MEVGNSLRPGRLRCTGSFRLEEDEECLQEEAVARRLIKLHLLHAGFAPDLVNAGNANWIRTESDPESSDEHLQTTRGRRTGNQLAVSGFAKDVIAGLQSPNFSLSRNLEQGDQRRGLDDERASEIAGIMREKGCDFDNARLELAKQRMQEAGIDPETGLPLDPKALLPLDCPDTRKKTPEAQRSSSNSKAAKARALISKLWGSSG